MDNIRLALRPLRKLYGHTPASAFDSLALEALRAQMVKDGRCRNRVNKDVARIKRMFRWGAAKKLVPLTAHQSLATVEGLRAGRSDARETAPVRPVPQSTVDATLPFLTPQVTAMVRLQLLTGMRPGEVAVMRGMDLEMGGKVWVYRPGSDQGPHGAHKTAYRGQHRQVLIGPRAQEVLRPWLRLNIAEYLFQPREAIEGVNEERRRNRKTPMTPNQAKRRLKTNPKKKPGDRYCASSYATAVAKGCDKACPHPDLAAIRAKGLPAKPMCQEIAAWVEAHGPELSAWREARRWHPNQLRHAKATEIRREFGLDAARVVLGHRSPCVTEVYAELDLTLAAKVAAEIG